MQSFSYWYTVQSWDVGYGICSYDNPVILGLILSLSLHYFQPQFPPYGLLAHQNPFPLLYFLRHVEPLLIHSPRTIDIHTHFILQ